MTKATVGLVNRTKLVIEKALKLKVLVEIFNRTKIASVLQNNRSNLVASAGVFYERFGKKFFEQLSLSTILAFIFNKRLEDVTQASDEKIINLTKVSQDYTNLEDTFARTVNYSRTFVENNQIIDLPFTSFLKVSQDAGELTDTFARSVVYNRAFFDTATATDDVNGAAADDDQNMVFFKNTSDITTISDLYSSSINYFRTFTETSSISDQRILGIVLNKSEVLGLLDSAQLVIQYSRILNHTTNTTDTPQYSLIKLFGNIATVVDLPVFQTNYIRNFEDTTTATDDVNGALTDDDQNVSFFKNLLDLNYIDDTATIDSQFIRTFTDQNDLVDSTIWNLSKPQNELLGITDITIYDTSKVLIDLGLVIDTASLDTQFFRNFQENLGITENVASTLSKPVDQYTTLSDEVFISVGYLKYFQESLALTSLHSLITTKPLTDNSSVTDQSQNAITKPLIEQATVSSQGFLVSQGYGSPSYFLEDYVGDSRTLS